MEGKKKAWGEKGPLSAAEPPDGERIRKWIADLDSDKFPVREAASRALGDLGPPVKPYLEDALNTSTSNEVLDRVRKILDGLMKISPEQLRQMRVVFVLELINDEESKMLLKKWAVGFKGAFLTEEAIASLKRLESMAKAKR